MNTCRALLLLSIASTPFHVHAGDIDFNRDIRSILSNRCLTCHGPDDAELQAGLRLDRRKVAVSELESGERAIVPGKPDESELIARVTTTDESLRMPPAETGKPLSQREVELLRQWIREGAEYAAHWSYVKPQRPPSPDLAKTVAKLKSPPMSASAAAMWPRTGVDHFLLDRMLKAGLKPSAEAERAALIRRMSLDLTGLPPTVEEVEEFLQDRKPRAVERLADRLLKKFAYGEHWARMWLDLARYADSAGYADDPPRTIWKFRDYVIRSLNANKPFDVFTVEQIAGDLLPNPSRDQLIATAFHRNTLTNNEGGTNDEEYRNVAIVDRVNTTMAVWMGTTIACAQCHNHKYDPISQEEFFNVFALFNSTEDADKRNESPLLEVWSDAQLKQKADWQDEIAKLKQRLSTTTPKLIASQHKWEQKFDREPKWNSLTPSDVKRKSGKPATVESDGVVTIKSAAETDAYTLSIPFLEATKLTALKLDALPDGSLPNKGPGHAGGNFVVTRISAKLTPPKSSQLQGRYVRIENTGSGQILSLAEVQVFSGGKNIATQGVAKQHSTAFNGPEKLAIDGTTNGDYQVGSVTHTNTTKDPWWEVDLKSAQPLEKIAIWNRTDNGLHTRLKDFKITVLDEARKTVWERQVATPPNPSSEFTLDGVRTIEFTAAFASHEQSGFGASGVLAGKDSQKTGWAVAPRLGQAHSLTLVSGTAVTIDAGSIVTVTIEQNSTHKQHILGRFRLSSSDDTGVTQYAKTPTNILAILRTAEKQRSDAQRKQLADFYLTIAPELKASRDLLAKVEQQLKSMKPETTVPVMRQLPANKQRVTKIQRRGNFLDLGKEVGPGVPAVFQIPGAPPIQNRLELAQWIVNENNPLTARVIVNRYWEALFGIGLVETSEEFGSQGELPSNPELLDWLATEFIAHNWDSKYLLKLLVTSSAYRQASKVTPELLAEDPDNRLLARGPRFRLSAEMIRDQALFVSGLLSDKMYGPPVKPPQPSLGLNAAFGGKVDWQTSGGEDRYRRGLYTTWRRSSPYPSMAAFDAPNREVCTIRRGRTNTPLQALVTLNDPVYIEAAQSLARKMAAAPGNTTAKAQAGFKRCLSREPSAAELKKLTALYEKARKRFLDKPQQAEALATNPLGPAPKGTSNIDLAAWTVVGNVLLNLDEMFMKR